jgi:hypothetical protein
VAVRAAEAPDRPRSSNTLPQPAASSVCSCGARFCSSVETRASVTFCPAECNVAVLEVGPILRRSKFLFSSLCFRQFAIQRLAIFNAAAQELRPSWHGWECGSTFWQETPKPWMMPRHALSERGGPHGNCGTRARGHRLPSGRSEECEIAILQLKAEDSDRGVGYWEVYDRRKRMKRLSDFASTEAADLSWEGRIELARQIIAKAHALHFVDAAHLDIGAHSVWLQAPSTVTLSHRMAASYPQVRSLGETRYQFLSSARAVHFGPGAPPLPSYQDPDLAATTARSWSRRARRQRNPRH